MLTLEGPIGKTNYRGYGDFTFMKKQIEPKVNKVILNAAGTGITPMYSIALASSLAKDGLKIFFMYSNKTKDDILCETELNELVAMNPDNFKLVHTLTRHDPAKHGEWSGKTGRVTWEMYQEFGFPTASDDLLVLTCGPAGFNETIKGISEANGLNFKL